MADHNRPLDGVRVLDLTRFPPGAYCTVLLADLGADVCRVDAPGSNPMMAGVGAGLSRNKRSAAVDLRHPRANEVLRKLAGWADVLVENNRPGDMDDRGFGPTHAATELPSLVWCSISGWGQDGPYARWPGHDLTYSAHSGLLNAVNPEIPWHPQTVLAVPLGAMMAATGIASALYERSRTGAGRHLDISLAESATWLLAGNDSQINPPTWGIPISADRRLYECADGRYVTVAAAEAKTWAALCGGLGLDDIASGPPRGEEAEAAAGRIAEVFATRPADDWVSLLGPLGAAIGAVNAGADLPRDPQVQARGSLVDVGGSLVPAGPVRFREAASLVPPRQGDPPAVGAHTEEVLAEAGFDPGEIAGLRHDGVIPA